MPAGKKSFYLVCTKINNYALRQSGAVVTPLFRLLVNRSQIFNSKLFSDGFSHLGLPIGGLAIVD